MTYEVVGGIQRASTNSMRRAARQDHAVEGVTTMIGRRQPVGSLLNVSHMFLALGVEDPGSAEIPGRSNYSKTILSLGTAVMAVFMAGGPIGELLIEGVDATYGDVLIPLDEDAELEWPPHPMTADEFEGINGGIEVTE